MDFGYRAKQEINYAVYKAGHTSQPKPAVIRIIRNPDRVVFDPLKVRRYTSYKEMWEAISRLEQRLDYLEKRLGMYPGTLDDLAHKW